MSVKRCQREVDGKEFLDWRAFDKLSPIGAERYDVLVASICQAIFNAMGGKQKLTDCLIEWGPREEPQYTPEEQNKRRVEVQRWRAKHLQSLHKVNGNPKTQAKSNVKKKPGKP